MVRTWLFVAIGALCGLVTLTGCTEEQLQQVDDAAAAVDQSTPQAGELVNSPAGGLLGEKGKGYALMGVTLAGALATAWQTYRRGQVTRTLGTVARAIERADPETQNELKPTIKAQMIAMGELAVQNRIIDKAKA